LFYKELWVLSYYSGQVDHKIESDLTYVDLNSNHVRGEGRTDPSQCLLRHG